MVFSGVSNALKKANGILCFLFIQKCRMQGLENCIVLKDSNYVAGGLIEHLDEKLSVSQWGINL